jgi:hypothetical protein
MNGIGPIKGVQIVKKVKKINMILWPPRGRSSN